MQYKQHTDMWGLILQKILKLIYQDCIKYVCALN